MTKVEDLVARFTANAKYSSTDHAVAQEWVNATGCGRLDSHLLIDPRTDLNADELELRDRIREKTLEFTNRYFDNRPNVVRSLDALFAEFGLSNEQARRREFLPFDKVYSHGEIMVLLLKHLQPTPGRERYTRENIAEYFLTSDRTINKRIGAMQPMADLELSAKVLGQIVQMDTARGTNVPESTTHPIFLPLSMVELYTLVDMLLQHVDDEVEGRIVQSILKCILNQTTEYAEERLARISGFDEASTSISQDGRQVPGEAVMFSEKEGIRAIVRYMKNNEEKTCSGRISRNHRNRTIIDVVEYDTVYHIPYRDIIELRSLGE